MTVLRVRNLKKTFGGIVAVDGVSFEVEEKEILGIIGPNGSGKSTLFNCILGQLQPSAGDVHLDGRPVTGMRPCDLNRLGVSRTFQLLRLRLDPALGLVPEISGNRLMVSVRLMRQEAPDRLQASNDNAQFELTLCS